MEDERAGGELRPSRKTPLPAHGFGGKFIEPDLVLYISEPLNGPLNGNTGFAGSRFYYDTGAKVTLSKRKWPVSFAPSRSLTGQPDAQLSNKAMA
jgi:hypothetical protein